MKRVILSSLVMGLLVGGAFSIAQGQEKRVTSSLNLGVQTNLSSESSFDNAWFTLDARFGVPVGRAFEISPEIMLAVDDSLHFSAVWLYPGAMLNFKLGSFFVGAGVVLPVFFYEGESDSGKLAPRINIGYRKGRLNVTAYILTWTEEYLDFLEVNVIGAALGYRF